MDRVIAGLAALVGLLMAIRDKQFAEHVLVTHPNRAARKFGQQPGRREQLWRSLGHL